MAKPIITRSVSSKLYRRVTIQYEYADSWHHETRYEEVVPDTRLEAIADAWENFHSMNSPLLKEMSGQAVTALLDALTEEER